MWISVSSRPTCSTRWVPGLPRLYKEKPCLDKTKYQTKLKKIFFLLPDQISSFLFSVKLGFDHVLTHFLEFDMSHTLYSDLHPNKMFCQIILRCSAKFLWDQNSSGNPPIPGNLLAVRFWGIKLPLLLCSGWFSQIPHLGRGSHRASYIVHT